MAPFQDVDFANFWNNIDYALEAYVMEPASDESTVFFEKELGYTLPHAYKVMMKHQNGGIPHNTCFPSKEPTSWAEDHVAISGIFGIGGDKSYSLCGDLGSQFMIDEWGYPAFGVYICSCPSAGHDMIMLDYRKCGKDGEPEVVHVDQDYDFRITFLAKDFETFIRGLVHDDVYSTAEEDLANDLKKVNEGNFSVEMALLMAQYSEINFNDIIRNICQKLTLEKGHFSLHDDELSYLMYDIQFLLYTHANGRVRKAQFIEEYPKFIALADGKFTTGGYAPGFVDEWLEKRISAKQITKHVLGGLKFSAGFEKEVLKQLEEFV